MLLSLPALLVTLAAGTLILGVPLAPHPLLLLVIPVAAIPLAALGALIGCSVRMPEEAGTVSLLVTLALVGLGPVLVPPARLPALFQILGTFSPATYAASAVRQTLLGPVTPRLALDLAVLGVLSLVLLWLVSRKMEWRQP
jgi:ABC-2 type transport system permease protein